MRQRHLAIIVLVAVVIALLAWALLASGKSDAPGAPEGSRIAATAYYPS
jgi:hypothetical protein